MGQPSDRGNRSVPSLLSEKDNLTRSKGAGGDFGNVHRHRRPRCYDVAEQVLRRHDNSEFEANIPSAVRDLLILIGLARSEGTRSFDRPRAPATPLLNSSSMSRVMPGAVG